MKAIKLEKPWDIACVELEKPVPKPGEALIRIVTAGICGSDIESIAVSPINAAEEHRAAVAEYMLRVNYGLKLGAFELDFRDGEVRFKSTLSALEGRPSSVDVARVVSMPVIMMDQFGEGLVKCMLGVGNPAEEAEKTRKK